MRPLLQRLRKNQKGIAAIEFSFIAMLMAVTFLSVYDLGSAIRQHIVVNQAVRAAGMYAFSYPNTASDIRAMVTSAASPYTVTQTTGSGSMFCNCRQTGGTVTVLSSCSNTCSGGDIKQRFVSIDASISFSPMLWSTLTTTKATHVVRITNN